MLKTNSNIEKSIAKKEGDSKPFGQKKYSVPMNLNICAERFIATIGLECAISLGFINENDLKGGQNND